MALNEAQLTQALQSKIDSGEMDQASADAVLADFKMQQLPEGNLASAIWEPTKAIGASMLGQVAAGGHGLFQLAKGDGLGEAVEEIEDVQATAAEIATPKTQAGTKALATVSDLIEMGVDVAQFSISGLAGILELVSGQGLDQAAQTVKDVQTKGVAATAGDRVLEETGSPIMATTAFMAPELVGAAVPIVGAVNKASRFQHSVAGRLRDAQANPVASRGIADFQAKIASGELVDDLYPQFERLIQESPPRIQKQLLEVADDVRIGADTQSVTNRLNDIANNASTAAADTSLVNYVQRGANGIKTDNLALDAIKQGFDQGVIASVKAATPLDRSKMTTMLDMLEKGKLDSLYAQTHRASDVAGNTLLERVKYIKSVNREAGADLDGIAKGLKGQPVEFDSAVNNFIARLDDMGIKLDSNLKPIFKGSDIEGATAAENVINKVVQRMSTGGAPDAHDLHRLKKYIDEQVTYGKSAEGLAGKSERVLKSLRSEIDDALDTQFPEYDRVNTAYAETVSALDSLQTSVGKKMDLFGDNADKATGTVLRRLMSNTAGRVNLMDAVDDIETIARKYGGQFDDNIQVQSLFADELEAVFNSGPRTAFQHSVGKAVEQGIQASTGQKTGLGMLAEAAGAVADKARGVNEANAVKSIRKLLERQ